VLLDLGAGKGARDEDNGPPLHCAAHQIHVKAANILLAHGADNNSKDLNGLVLLHHAAWNSHLEIIKVLLSD
jgi:ankyrin repeat protein